MFTAGKARFLKWLSALHQRLSGITFHRSRAFQAACLCITLFSSLLLFGFALIGIFYIKFFRLKCQAGILREVMGSFPVYSFPSQSVGLFEFYEGQLKVNTTLYAW